LSGLFGFLQTLRGYLGSPIQNTYSFFSAAAGFSAAGAAAASAAGASAPSSATAAGAPAPPFLTTAAKF